MNPVGRWSRVLTGLLVVACGGTDENRDANAGGTMNTGGAAASTAGAAASTGGSASNIGGEFASVGGGTSNSGGSNASGGTSSNASNTNSTAGMSAATGGVNLAGGTSPLATGASNPVTGGATSSGGTPSSQGGTSSSAGASSVAGGSTGTATTSMTGGTNAVSDCVIHVTTSGSDTNAGDRWSTAFANIQPAIVAAANKVTANACSLVEVWVARGTYKPTLQLDANDARSATFQLAAHVALYGGFAGIEATLGERNITANVTTLSGDLGSPDDASDNSYHVVVGANDAIMDGFTITGGNADDTMGSAPTPVPNGVGGGVFNESSAPTIANCTFLDNVASVYGGGLGNISSSPTVIDCTFTGNRAGLGGGIGNFSSSSPIVTHCTFTGNSGGFGGGMGNFKSSSPIVTNCTFADNSGSWGAGMNNDDSTPTVTNCVFLNNESSNGGGGMDNSAASAPIIANCTFLGNLAYSGGAISSVASSSPTVLNSILWGDSASKNPELANDSSFPMVTYSIVSGGFTGTGNLDLDPQLDSNLTPTLGSPAIDGGGCASYVRPTDIAGNGRWIIAGLVVPSGTTGGGVDIGAYEYQGSTANGDTLVPDFACP